MQFRVLQGQFSRYEKDGKHHVGLIHNDKGHELPGIVCKVYNRGEVIDTPLDLIRMFDQPPHGPMGPKFQRLDEESTTHHGLFQHAGESLPDFIKRCQDAQAQKELEAEQERASINTATDTFESMTVDELRKVAAEEEVDLGNARKREDIIRVLRGRVGV